MFETDLLLLFIRPLNELGLPYVVTGSVAGGQLERAEIESRSGEAELADGHDVIEALKPRLLAVG